MSNYLENSKKYKGYHYSVLTNEMIQYLHETTLSMLKIIVPIFEKNDIRYMICGGTLLGAVTTNRFIPWDDDVDICIFEEDYERAIDSLIENIPDWMFVQWYNTEPKYFHGWIKVRDKNSHVFPDTVSYKENGVWIDLYKLTLAKKSEVPYLISKEHLDYLYRRYNVGDISQDERDKRIADNNLIKRIENEKKASDNSLNSEFTYIIWSASKILVDEKWCLPRKKYLFEGMELFSFNDADQYLSRHYGEDYMTLPPDEMRRVGLNYIDFGDD